MGSRTRRALASSAATVLPSIAALAASTLLLFGAAASASAAGNFWVWATPTNVSFAPGQTGTIYVGFATGGGFNGTVVLTASSTPSGVTMTCFPSSISPSQVATCTLGSSTAGSYSVAITGTNGTLVNTASISVSVGTPPTPNFSLSANPGSVSFVAGQNATSTIGLTASGGFVGTVALTASSSPSGVTTSCSPTSITGTQTSTCTLTSSAAGSYSVTVTGTSGSLVRTATIGVSVSAAPMPDFSLWTNPTSVSFVAGQSATSMIGLTATGGFTGTVALAASSSPPGVTTSCSPTSISGAQTSTCTMTSSAAGSYTVTVTGSSGSLTHTTTIGVSVTAPPPTPDFTLWANPTSVSFATGQSATSTIGFTPTGGFTGTVALVSGSSPFGVTVSCSPSAITGTQTSTCTMTASTAGSYTVTITGWSGTLWHDARIAVTVTMAADFSLAASPNRLSFVANGSATSTIALTSAAGFAGTVDLTTSSTPSGVATTCSPTSLTGSQTSTCTLTSSAAGSYTVTVGGTSGSLAHTATIDVTVSLPPDFSLAADPTAVWLSAGQPAMSTIRLQLTGGFAGTVDLTYTSVPAGTTTNCVPWSIAGSQASNCTLNGPNAGSYTVTISGRSGALVHATRISVTITSAPPQPDFALRADPDHLSLPAGTSTSTIVSVISFGGFSGAVDLSVASAPPEVTASCYPSHIGDRGTASCTVSGGTPGAFQVWILGTSGSTGRAVPIAVTVTPGPAKPDKTPPEVSITSPTDGGTVPVGPAVVSGRASDDAALQKVELSTDNVTWSRANGTTSWSGTVTLGPGMNTIYVRATDAAGNVRTIGITVLGSPGLSATSPPWSQSPLALGSAAQVGLIALVPLAAVAVGLPLAVRARQKRGRTKGASGGPVPPASWSARAIVFASSLKRFLRLQKKS